MNNNRFSIITVTYNCVDTIEKTIVSIIRQKYTNYEYIVIDGDSSDGTKDILNMYNKYISVLISEPDEGIYYAMNKGISYATGDVIFFLNGDDYLISDDVLENVNTELVSNNPDILSARVFDGIGISKKNNREIVETELKYHAMMPHQGLFARKKVFDRIGIFDVKYSIAADYEWMLRAFLKGETFFFSDLIVSHYSPNGRSKCDTGILEQIEISREYLERFGTEDEILLSHQYNINAIRMWLIKKILREYSADICKIIIPSEAKERDIALFGGGRWGIRLYEVLEKHEKNNRIKFIYDNNPNNTLMKRWSNKNVKICHYNEKSNCYILVTMEKRQDELAYQLNKSGKKQLKDYLLFDDIGNRIIYFGVKEKAEGRIFIARNYITTEELLYGVSKRR